MKLACPLASVFSEWHLLKEQGGRIVSILSMEYDVEIAKRVYAEEMVEDKTLEIAKKMLKCNRPLNEIMEDTGLTFEEVESLQRNEG